MGDISSLSENCEVFITNEAKEYLKKKYTCPSDKVEPTMYLQFGQVVFNGERTIESYSSQFRTNVIEKLGASGGSISFGGEGFQLINSTTLSLTVQFSMRYMNFLEQSSYVSYIKSGLLGKQRLWAVTVGGELVWTWAVLSNFSENIGSPIGTFSVAMEFVLPDGYWHIADLSKVYLKDISDCDFYTEYGRKCQQNCLEEDFAGCVEEDEEECCDLCDNCSNIQCVLSNEDLFCNTDIDLYWTCQADYEIIYSCKSNDDCNIFNNFGLKFKQNNKNSITGAFCSYTVYGGVAEVTLVGNFTNPVIKINENQIIINGKYRGIIQIKEDGRVIYYEGANTGKFCTSEELIGEVDYCNGRPSFSTHGGLNSLLVTGASENMAQVVYINQDERTFL